MRLCVIFLHFHCYIMESLLQGKIPILNQEYRDYYVLLVAGASAFDTPSRGGALSFNVYGSSLWAYWNYGSAEKHIGLYYF